MSSRFLKTELVHRSSDPIVIADLRTSFLNVFQIMGVFDTTRKVKDALGDVTEQNVVEIHSDHVGGLGSSQNYYILDTTAEQVVDEIERRIHCEMDYARTGSAHLEPSPPVRLGTGGSENNQAVAETTVADIDLYPILRFSGRSGATAAKALASVPFSVDVPVSALGVSTTPLPSVSGHLKGPSGTVYVSRSEDGTKLYMLGEDGAAAFGITVEGVSA